MTKNIFSSNSNIDLTAYINWRTSRHEHINNMLVIAEGFMSSALLLTRDTIRDNDDHKADILIFPILFNANHAIELYLKAITWTLNIALNKSGKIEGSHNIRQILDVVKSRVNEFETVKEQRTEFKSMIKDLDNYIDELFSKIQTDREGKDNMDFSRYPFDGKYVPHFYINEIENVTIDLQNLYERFTEIDKNLRSIAYYYLDIVDYIKESNYSDY